MGINDILNADIKNANKNGENVPTDELFAESMVPRRTNNIISYQGYSKKIKNGRVAYENGYSELSISNNPRLNGVYVLGFAAIKFIDTIILETKVHSFIKIGKITNKEEGKIDWDFMSFSSDHKTIYRCAEKIAMQYGDKNHDYRDFEKFVKK